MKFLVDANVLSEATRPGPNPMVVHWLRRNEAGLVVTPIILGELQYGIFLLPQGRQRRLLEKWFEESVTRIAIVEFDTSTATEWAQLLAELKRKATPMPVKDSLIAASALRHRLTIATRNIRDFSKAGVPLINPFLEPD